MLSNNCISTRPVWRLTLSEAPEAADPQPYLLSLRCADRRPHEVRQLASCTWAAEGTEAQRLSRSGSGGLRTHQRTLGGLVVAYRTQQHLVEHQLECIFSATRVVSCMSLNDDPPNALKVRMK